MRSWVLQRLPSREGLSLRCDWILSSTCRSPNQGSWALAEEWGQQVVQNIPMIVLATGTFQEKLHVVETLNLCKLTDFSHC